MDELLMSIRVTYIADEYGMGDADFIYSSFWSQNLFSDNKQNGSPHGMQEQKYNLFLRKLEASVPLAK